MKDPTTTPPPGTVPYVGLRPFEHRDSHLFFGRERDAQFLVDKLFSSPLTLLYGRSGLGKSSLLRALVIPQLQQHNEATVLYFDAWSGERPLDELKQALEGLADELGVVDPFASTPTLLELVRLVADAGDRPVILLLDQFEEFLVTHGARLDPLRRELGSLVRTTAVDVRVVLSLREEFLAAIEPFRVEILTLFASTYRLEPLETERVVEAIEKPASLFGVHYSPELVQRLVQDLRLKTPSSYAEVVAEKVQRLVQDLSLEADIDAPRSESTQLGIDLPILQLVCQELWRNHQAAGGGELLKLRYYEAMGGTQQIVEDYVARKMPHTGRARLLVAQLMLYLAPASGLKQSFTADDLANYTRQDSARVLGELERLERDRILHTREFRGTRRFELEHDKFTEILRPWAQEIRIGPRGAAGFDAGLWAR